MIRLAKKIILQKNVKISLPSLRPVQKLKTDIKGKISSGEIYIGEPVAPKTIVKTKLSNPSTLNQETEKNIWKKNSSAAHQKIIS